MSGKNTFTEKIDGSYVPRYFSKKFWWWPLFGFVMAVATYGTGHSSVANTPLSTIPIVCATSIFISFLFPLASWVEKRWGKAILSPVILVASLLLAGIGWGIVIGVKNATIVESIFTNWIYGVTIPLLTSTFMALFVAIYYTLTDEKSINCSS